MRRPARDAGRRGRRGAGSGEAGAGRRGGGGRHVERAVAEVRASVAGRLAVVAGAWSGAALCALLAAAALAAGADGWAAGSAGPLAVVAAMAGVVAGAFWWWFRLRRRWGGEPAVAKAMDVAAGLADGTVLGGLELSRAAPRGTSALLRDLAVRTISRRLAGSPAALSGPLGLRLGTLARRAWLLLAVMTAALAATVFRAPGTAASAWSGLASPLAVLAEPVLPPLRAEPGTTDAPRDAEIEVVLHAPSRDSARLHWESTGQVAQARPVALRDGTGRTRLPPLSAVTRYWVEVAGGARSPVYVLTPVDPLFVSALETTVVHPVHTGLPPGRYRGGVPELEVVEGSRISVRGAGNRTIGRLRLAREDGRTEVEFQVDGASFSGAWTPTRPGVLAWEAFDATGEPAAATPEPLRIGLVADSPPRVAIEHPEPVVFLPAGMRQPVVARAQDDYGVSRVEIVAWRVSAFGERGAPVVLVVRAEGAAGVIARPVLDVSSWRLSPGDTLRYFARAVDNHPSGQSAETGEQVLRVPGALDLDRAAADAMNRAAEAAEALAAEAAAAEEQGRALLEAGGDGTADRDARGGRGEFADREEIARAMERRDRLATAVDSLRNELAALREALEDSGLSSASARERLRELAGALEAAPQAKRDERAGLSEMEAAEAAEALERAVRDQEELGRRMEEALAAFERAAVDQGLDVAVRDAADLAEMQDLLAASVAESGGGEQAASRQETLAERAAGLEAQVRELMERLEGMGDSSAQEGLQAAASRLSQGSAAMQQAARMARQENAQVAGQEAARAAGDLSRAARSLDEAGAQMRQQRTAALQTALARTAVDALALARRQAELLAEMRGANAAELADLRGPEAAIAQGIRNLAENYASETAMAAPGARDLLAAAGQALESLDRAVEAMGSRRASSHSLGNGAEEVVRALNEAARLAMVASQEGQSAGAASAGDAMTQQMAQLAERQGDILQDAAALAPMQLGPETAARETRAMADKQEAVADGLGELAQQEGEGDRGPLGGVADLAREANQIAEALAQGRFDPQVLRRQERLFHRLLDAGRGLEQDEESKERESQRPGAFAEEEVAPLSVSDLDGARYRLPGPGAMRALPPAVRALVVRYFQRLNDAPGAEAPPPPGEGTPRRPAPRGQAGRPPARVRGTPGRGKRP